MSLTALSFPIFILIVAWDGENPTTSDHVPFNIPVMIVAAIGGILVALIARRANPGSLKYIANVRIYNVLLALTIALVLFSFFPATASISGTVEGLKINATGALAAFVIIWYLSDRHTTKDFESGKLNASIAELKEIVGEKQAEIARKDADIAALSRKPEMLPKSEKHLYPLKGTKGKQIILLAELIQNVKNVDVLVNSENTNMFMSRPLEKSVSGALRYYGAKRDGTGITEDGDLIAKSLADEVKKICEKSGVSKVEPATVIVTTAGALEENGAKKIFHVASVEGAAGYGFRPIPGIERCVTKALEEADKHDFTTIALPMLGAGQAEGDINEDAPKLIQEAFSYLKSDRVSSVKEVYFLTLTKKEFLACDTKLNELGVAEKK